MYVFYVDEAGAPEQHHVPLVSGETPIFTLNSLSLKVDDWKSLDREYLKLKLRFYQKEIGVESPEYYEVKGTELARPGNRNNRRGHQFIEQILRLCQKYSLRIFSIIFIKNPNQPTSKRSLYTMAL